MTTEFTTDNIDGLVALPIDTAGGWRVTFRSANAGMHHQLYVNGRLADWTDTAAQPGFELGAEAYPRELTVAAVAPARRMEDCSHLLPKSHSSDGWVFRASVLRREAHQPGDVLAVHGDHAAGEMDPAPLLVRELYPRWLPRWGWGFSPFGDGAFGFGGAGAPGFGEGAFGAVFAAGAEALRLSVPLAEEGRHELVLRTLSSDGRCADAESRFFDSAPPPAPAKALHAIDYDAQTQTLTLEIERG